MAKIIRFNAADWNGLTVISVIGVGAWLFRFQAIQPFWTVGACAVAGNRPMFCGPRAVVLCLQYQQAFGWLAFVLGVAAFVPRKKIRRPTPGREFIRPRAKRVPQRAGPIHREC